MADVSVRPALPADAGAIARIQLGVWQLAFAQLLPASVLALTPEQVAPNWAQSISAPPTRQHHVLVALERNDVVGFAALAPVPDDEPAVAEATYALGPILVEPRWGRRGHGSRLLAAAADTTTAAGIARLICWLAESDKVSQAFLTGAGWQIDGYARGLATGDGEIREIRLHTALGEAQ